MGHDFGWALGELNKGNKVTRTGWNGPNQFLRLHLPPVGEYARSFYNKYRRCSESTCLQMLDDPTLDEAAMQGEIAADQAHPIQANPYPMGILAHAWWEAGHSRSTDELCGRNVI